MHSVFLFFLLLFSTSVSFAASPGKIALIQYDGDRYFDLYEVNKVNLTKMAMEAIDDHANIIVFPEGSLYGYASSDRQQKWCAQYQNSGCHDVSTVAESVPGGKSTTYWAELAIQNHIYILFNILEKDNAQTFYNTSVVVGPNGYVAKYRKRVLYATDLWYATPGTDPYVLNTEWGNFGLLICLDATDPGPLEMYKSTGVNSVILMMDWDDDPNAYHAARTFFQKRSQQTGVTIYASDMSPWDGAGKYAPGLPRERNGLQPVDIGKDGITIHDIN